jgi:hypothetical protein
MTHLYVHATGLKVVYGKKDTYAINHVLICPYT